MFHITRATHLEDEDGNDKRLVVGVEFDVAAAVEGMLSRFRFPTADADCNDAVKDVTLAGDGGPERRRTLNVFTFTVPIHLLSGGRSPLVPALVVLGGESAIHQALGDRLHFQVRRALARTYTTNGLATEHSAVVTRAPATVRTAPVRLPYVVRFSGDFAMLAHMMSTSGGANRCPYWWPCAVSSFISHDA